MPYADLERQRKAQRESARRRRAARRAEREASLAEPVERDWPADAGQALAEWSAAALTVPYGHPLAGQPMRCPPYIAEFMSDAFAPGVKEALLCMGRKNSKTGGCAIAALAHLVEGAPFAGPGKRLAVVSLDKSKANELRREAELIALASRLPGLEFLRSPAPGLIRAENGSELTILAGDANAGAAGGYDAIFVDEIGLFEEKNRPLVESLLGSTGARNGRVIYLSIFGNGLFTGPLVKRQDDEAVVVHHYAPRASADVLDEEAWAAGNPGLACGIKSLEHMRSLARRALVDRPYGRTFRRGEMNLPGATAAGHIVELSDWQPCAEAEQPPRAGACWLGLDIGGSASMCGAAAWWENGRLAVLGGWPKHPALDVRGKADGVGDMYERMMARGELVLFGDRWADAESFVKHVRHEWLAGVPVIGAWADGYRKEEVAQAVGNTFPVYFRRMGAGPDGHADIAAFQREVVEQRLRPGRSLTLEHAILEGVVRIDEGDNMSLHKGRSRGRIDVLSAAVLAVSAGSRAVAGGYTDEFHIAVA